jgi:flagellar protein FlbD
VIAVTCRNGERFSVDPSSIERIETDPDTVVYLVDGTKYVINEGFEEVLRRVRDQRAAFVAASHQLTRTATRSLHPSKVIGRSRDSTDAGNLSPVRLERRQYARDDSAPREDTGQPATDGD